MLETTKYSKILCNPNESPYQRMLANKFCEKIGELPNRKCIELKGAWLAVHMQNNVISHFSLRY